MSLLHWWGNYYVLLQWWGTIMSLPHWWGRCCFTINSSVFLPPLLMQPFLYLYTCVYKDNRIFLLFCNLFLVFHKLDWTYVFQSDLT
jgi:hypothetical protein